MVEDLKKIQKLRSERKITESQANQMKLALFEEEEDKEIVEVAEHYDDCST